MHYSRLLCITTLFIVLTSVLWMQPDAGWSEVSPAEKTALITLYNSTDGVDWIDNTSEQVTLQVSVIRVLTIDTA